MSTDPPEWTNKASERRGLTSWYRGHWFVDVAPGSRLSGTRPVTQWVEHFLHKARCCTDVILNCIIINDNSWFCLEFPGSGLEGSVKVWNPSHVCCLLALALRRCCALVAPLLLLLPIYQWALLRVSESTQHNYKTSGAFNLLLISQQLWWKALSPINVSKHDPTMSRPPHNPINNGGKKKAVLEIDLPQWQRFNFYKAPNRSTMCQVVLSCFHLTSVPGTRQRSREAMIVVFERFSSDLVPFWHANQ